MSPARIEKRAAAERRKKIAVCRSILPSKSMIHPFDWCLACKWGVLAIILTLIYVFMEMTSPVSPAGLANMAGIIIVLGTIVSLFLTISRARRIIRLYA